MKSNKRRKNEKKFLDENAILIKCIHCNNVDVCTRKKTKINNERKGIRTFCTLCPNDSKKTLGKLTLGKSNMPK